MNLLLHVLEWTSRFVFVAVAIVAFRLWRQHRSQAAAWAAAMFADLGAAVLIAYAGGPDANRLPLWALKGLLGILLLFPYFLYRFAAAFRPPPRWSELAALAVTVAVVGWSLALPSIPQASEPRRLSFELYVYAILLQWSVLSVPASFLLWRSGRRQPTLPRRRMYLFALAAVGLNTSILVSGAAGGARPVVVSVIVQSVSVASALLFYIALSPPAALRASWRKREQLLLRRAAEGVSAATTTDQVSSALLPHIAPLFGGGAALLADRTGNLIGAHGMATTEAERIAASLQARRRDETAPELLVFVLRNGWLAVTANVYAPFFGREEIEQLAGIGSFIDLAMDRAELFEAEQRAHADLERANEEVESFLYSVSHDLKSPLVSLSGYIGCLTEEFGAALDTTGRHYLERMSANASYMEDLINDLLELSRVGRFQTERTEVDLTDVVAEIATELEATHIDVSIDVRPLPVVWMNPVRCRQLFTNVLENAVKHAGRDAVRVEVTSRQADDGRVEISVADDGQGVPASYRNKVFEPFERLGDTNGDGTGIGLSICNKIMLQLGGRIWIAASDRGTDVRIAFPVHAVRARSLGRTA